MTFFVGLHQPSDAKHFEHSFISVHRLRRRKSNFPVRKWILDSGAFRTIFLHGGYPHPVEEYGEQITRWANCIRDIQSPRVELSYCSVKSGCPAAVLGKTLREAVNTAMKQEGTGE